MAVKGKVAKSATTPRVTRGKAVTTTRRVPVKKVTVPRSIFTMAFRAYVEGYVALVQEELRLQDWVLKVDWKTPPPDECHAAIVPHTNSKHASIVLHPTFMDLDNEARRQALVHEVMHCHVFDVHHTAELMIEKSTRAKSTFDMAAEVLNARVEILTDVLADVMAPYFPPFDAP